MANLKNFCFLDFSTLKCQVSVNIDCKHLIYVSFWSDLFTYQLEYISQFFMSATSTDYARAYWFAG